MRAGAQADEYTIPKSGEMKRSTEPSPGMVAPSFWSPMGPPMVPAAMTTLVSGSVTSADVQPALDTPINPLRVSPAVKLFVLSDSMTSRSLDKTGISGWTGSELAIRRAHSGCISLHVLSCVGPRLVLLKLWLSLPLSSITHYAYPPYFLVLFGGFHHSWNSCRHYRAGFRPSDYR